MEQIAEILTLRFDFKPLRTLKDPDPPPITTSLVEA